MSTLHQNRIEKPPFAPAPSRRRSSYLSLVEWILALILGSLFIATGFIPAWQTLNTDFPNYYVAASLYRQGIPIARAYEWIWFQREKDHLGIDQPLVGFMPNPPLCALPVLPLTYYPALTAKRIWLVLNLSFLALSLFILHRVTSLPWRRLLLITSSCTLPLRTNFICGQYYVLILLLLCGAYYFALTTRRFRCGLLVAAAASLKLFPAVFLLLFVRKRDWRSAAGLLLGLGTLAGISVAMFGLDVHRVWIAEVLPRALRGDIIDPYALGWSSFSALWHRMFLFEPQLNPAPLANLPIAYALAQAGTTVLILFSFFGRVGGNNDSETTPTEWAAFIPLLLLLSSMPSPYHYCILVLSAIVGADTLWKRKQTHASFVLLFLFVLACLPVPDSLFGGQLLLIRLFATLAFYVFLLPRFPATFHFRFDRTPLVASGVVLLLLFVTSFGSTRGRREELARRLPMTSPGYSSGSPAMIQSQLAFREMVNQGYQAMTWDGTNTQAYPISGDILALSGSVHSSFGFFEQVNRLSRIVRLDDQSLSTTSITEGQNPVLSNDGHRLLFTKTDRKQTSVWVMDAEPGAMPRKVLETTVNLMDVNFGWGRTVIAASGPVSTPSLVSISEGQIRAIPGVDQPARYPAIAPDGKHLAFCRRRRGAWQLMVRDMETGHQSQLTSAPCNATEPFWKDDGTLLYATDCGRGLGLTALAQVSLRPLR